MTSPAYASADTSNHSNTSDTSIDPIDITQEDSLNYWVAALDCSELELRVAVAEVGPAAKDVSNELGKML
ncbi:DUF3606 domain-containing protein [Polaromonas sp. YR568]|uniref:DUF3606 domain-containing protein n=1 Tax=Polaromonas sp. YR568 TaxID=1855301 RepID=UPI00398BD6C5